MQERKKIKFTLTVAAAILMAVLAVAWYMFGAQLTAANTIQKMDDGLWSMEYRGDYGFDKFLAQGGAASDEEMTSCIASFILHGFWKPAVSIVEGSYGGSTLSAKNPNGEALFGRNFDWNDGNTMIVHTIPEDGYESISTCCLDFLGLGEDWVPDGSMKDKFMALAAVYVPLDGMNEKGLCVADLIVNDGDETYRDTDKPDLTATSAIRLMLDKAATVDEAVELLKQYDINFPGSDHHFAISDAAGKSVVAEYMGNEMSAMETSAVTNQYIIGAEGIRADGLGVDETSYTERQLNIMRQSETRYDTLLGLLQEAGGVMTSDEVRSALAQAAQSNFIDTNSGVLTRWSLVCNQQALTATFYDTEDWEHPCFLKLKEKRWRLYH